MGMFNKSLVLAASLVGASAAQADTIDSFNVPMNYSLTTVGSTSQTLDGLDPAQVIGGKRHVAIDKTAGAGELNVRINFFHPGQGALSSDSGIAGNFTLAYGSLIPQNSGLGADFTGDKFFKVDFTAADMGASVRITVEDGDSQSSAMVAIDAGPTSTIVPFSMFSDIDFSMVNGIKVEVLGVDSYDARIDHIATAAIPVPAAVYPGLALLGGLVVRRFRKRA